MKKTLMAALALFAAGSVWAQTEQNKDITETVEYSTDKYKVETNSFWSNWFISAGLGGQVYLGDHDKQRKFGERISPALDIAVGKWFTPGIGVRLMYSGLNFKGATQAGPDQIYSNGQPIEGKPWDGYWLTEQKVKYINFHADVLFNLSNILCGYNEKRVYNCSPYFGLGIARVTSKPKNTEITGHLGIMNSFRLSSAWDLNLDLRASLTNDQFDGEIGGKGGEGMFGITAGVTYKIKPRGWDRSKTILRVDNSAINALRDELDRANAENARLQRAINESNRQEPAKKVVASNLIVFQIGKSKLSNEARVNLKMMAEAIKASDPNAVYTITGYADAGTGSKKLNERLSKKRAEAVYDCLVNEFGVSASQLRIDYKGGVDNMFYDDPRLSRAAITRSN